MKNILASSLLILSLGINTYANEKKDYQIFDKHFKITLKWLEDKPKSIAKDFFIIQFFKQEDTSKEEALKAFDMVKRKSKRVLKAYRKIIPKDIPDKELKCYRLETKDLLKEDSKCLALGLSIRDAIKLSKKDLKKAILKLDEYPVLRDDLKILSSKKPIKELFEDRIHRFYRIFFKTGSKYRRKYLDEILPNDFMLSIIEDKQFSRFVKYVVLDKDLNKLKKSLLSIRNDLKDFSHKTLFYLGINAIKNKQEKLALKYLNIAYDKAYYQFDKDKVLFWKYLLEKKNEDFKLLANSWDNNIYSLYAKELIKTKAINIIYDINIKNTKTKYNIYDSFSWLKVLEDSRKKLDEEKLEKYKNIFTSKETVPHLAYILERFYRYKISYFITPFEDIMKNFLLEDKIMLYSLARQESRFIPSSISFSTALGVMQIMPFLSKAIAKEYKENYNIYEQFNPKVNILYAKRHLKVLKKQFKNNPLFIAYAYNGGAGYTRSQLKKGLFKKGKYEPFLSMESISYEETRKYGKNVLANYYIYRNYLDKKHPMKLADFFKQLVNNH